MKNKIRFLLIIFFVFLANAGLFATAQQGDVTVINDESYSLFSNPLESLFNKNPEIKEKFDYICSKHSIMISSACWRGYIAKFEIIDSSLYIIDITIEISEESKISSKNFKIKRISVFRELFETAKPVLCSFYSDMLIIPQGDIVKYVHGGYSSEFEKYILLKITDGKVINKEEFSLQEFKEKIEKAFESFYKSEKYKECWNLIKTEWKESIDDQSRKNIMKLNEDFYLYDFFEF